MGIVAVRPMNTLPATPYSMDDLLRMGEILIQSKLAPEAIQTKEQAAAIMLQGRELGLQPMESLQVLYSPRQGQVGRLTKLLVAQFRAAGHDYVVRESTPTVCTVDFYLASGRQLQHTITRAECDEAGWSTQSKNGQRETKYPWKAMPAIMLRYRCLSTGINKVAPEVYRRILTQTGGDESDDMPDADVWGDSAQITDRIAELQSRIVALQARHAELQVAAPTDNVIEGTVTEAPAAPAKRQAPPWQGAFWAWVREHMLAQGLHESNVNSLYTWAKETGWMKVHLAEYENAQAAEADYTKAVRAWVDREGEVEEIPV